MPKIRSIKPESCVSEPLADVSQLAALAFAYLPCFCDDEGRTVCSARRMKAQLFPMRGEVTVEDCDRVIEELERVGLVRTYEASGRLYLHVTGFAEHQHPNRPKPSELPAPPGDGGSPACCPDGAPPAQGQCSGSGEALAGQRSSGSGSGSGKGGDEGARDRAAVEEVVGRLNAATGKSFRASTRATASAIRARLREGYTVGQMLAVIDAKAAEWGPDPNMRRHLCPETLFRPAKFEKYVNELAASSAAGRGSHAAYD